MVFLVEKTFLKEIYFFNSFIKKHQSSKINNFGINKKIKNIVIWIVINVYKNEASIYNFSLIIIDILYSQQSFIKNQFIVFTVYF